jgi:ribosomal protein L29
MSENLNGAVAGEGVELRAKVIEAKKKLLSLRLGRSGGDLKDTSVFGKERREIARLFTKLNRRECRDGSK